MKQIILYICNYLKMMANFYSLLASQLSNQGSKSNIVKPLTYVMAMLLIAAIISLKLKIDLIGYIVLGLFTLVLIAFLITYFICLFKNPDLLRSEKYNLEKTAIEKTSILGDSRNQPLIIPGNRDYVSYQEQGQNYNQNEQIGE